MYIHILSSNSGLLIRIIYRFHNFIYLDITVGNEFNITLSVDWEISKIG